MKTYTQIINDWYDNKPIDRATEKVLHEVLASHKSGESLKDIALKTYLDVKTVKKIIKTHENAEQN